MGKRNRKTWPWKAWGERGRLKPNEIHIHLLQTGSVGFKTPVKDLLSFLPVEERWRYAQFDLEDRRREFLWSRLLVRLVLASFLDKNMRDLNFGYQGNGKPFLKNEEIQFNLSHAEGFIACSVAQRRLGVDVEKRKRRGRGEKRWNLLAGRYFSTAEREYLLSQDRASRSNTFFRIFTMKEARVKASGEGLSLPLVDFSVPLPLREISATGPWEYFTKFLEPNEIFLAHVVENPNRMPLQYQLWDWDEASLGSLLTDPIPGSFEGIHGNLYR